MSKKTSWLIALFGSVSFLLNAAPVFQPDVKQYRPGSASFPVADLPVFHEDQRQCEIGAGEIPGAGKTVKGIKDISGKGIYLANAESPAGKQLIKAFELEVPAQEQGYAIAAKDGRIAIVGRDPVGTLYGAVTLRQMIENGKVTAATVRDWPDIAYRGGMSYCRGLSRFAVGENGDGVEAAYQAAIDELLRHKLNIIGDFRLINPGLLLKPKSAPFLDQTARITRYAEERGMYINVIPMTALWYRYNHPAGVTRKNWPCVSDGRSWKDQYFCWADDQENEAAAERYAAFIRRVGLTRPLVGIHPVDGGGTEDPESWSKRCARCRARWKDDERWKATVNQLNIWNRVLKKHFPEAIVGSPVYPYTIGWLGTPENNRGPLFKQNVTEFWKNVSAGIPDRKFHFGSWIPASHLLKPYRELVGDRSIRIGDPFMTTAGIFTTSHRFASSCLEDNRDDNFFTTNSLDSYGRWESNLLLAEHAWNRNAPGNEVYEGGTYYDGVRDHIGPAVIMEKTLPRICYTFWGPELAPYMTKIMASGIAPGYIEDPAKTVIYWNKIRRDPLYDPNVPLKTLVENKVKPVVDTPELMKLQMDAAIRVNEVLNEAKPHIGSLDRYKRKYFMYFAKRAPFWLAAARAEYNIRIGTRLTAERKNAEAVEWLKKAGEQLKADYDAAESNLKALRKEFDAESFFKWKRGRDVMMKRLDSATASAGVILKPRRIGRFIRVGITSKGRSANGTKEYLDGFANVKASVIDDISLAELDKYDCVIFTSGAYDKEEFFRNVAAYAERGGGGVFLEGYLCGGKRFDTRTAFPEIVKTSSGRVDNFSRKLFKADKSQVQSMYVDYYACVPGEKGEVVVRAGNGDAVTVRGPAGAGKVVFSGTFNIASKNGSYDAEYVKLFGGNAQIVREAIEYFTGLKLREKEQ